MAYDVRDWLSELGLEKFAEAFEANEIDLGLASDLADTDLRDLGVTTMGPRKKLLRAKHQTENCPASRHSEKSRIN